MEKYTKKASARILKEVLKIDSKASGFTTLDQAFVTLMDHWDMYIDVVNSNNTTVCTLYRDDDKPRAWNFKNAWDSKEGDWDWNTIYKTVLEDIIKERLYKRPKLGKRAMKKLEEAKKLKAQQEATPAPVVEEKKSPKVSLDDLRKKRGLISARISNAKKRGLPVSDLERELATIKDQIKNFAKTE
jgi:CRISPR-associated protein Cas8b1/Cst1 subtype I-B